MCVFMYKALFPVIHTTWRANQKEIIDKLCGNTSRLILGGDGRADSPGHCAKYGTYTMMELQINRVIDVQVVQVILLYPCTINLRGVSESSSCSNIYMYFSYRVMNVEEATTWKRLACKGRSTFCNRQAWEYRIVNLSLTGIMQLLSGYGKPGQIYSIAMTFGTSQKVN